MQEFSSSPTKSVPAPFNPHETVQKIFKNTSSTQGSPNMPKSVRLERAKLVSSNQYNRVASQHGEFGQPTSTKDGFFPLFDLKKQ